jgi:hypothetical protein
MGIVGLLFLIEAKILEEDYFSRACSADGILDLGTHTIRHNSDFLAQQLREPLADRRET